MPGHPGGAPPQAADTIDVLSDLFILRGVPAYVRSDNGPEFAANAVRGWISGVGAKTAFIELGSPWENGYAESFMYGRPPRCKRDVGAWRRSGAFMYSACWRGPHDRWP